jgi:hypothetical protein
MTTKAEPTQAPPVGQEEEGKSDSAGCSANAVTLGPSEILALTSQAPDSEHFHVTQQAHHDKGGETPGTGEDLQLLKDIMKSDDGQNNSNVAVDKVGLERGSNDAAAVVGAFAMHGVGNGNEDEKENPVAEEESQVPSGDIEDGQPEVQEEAAPVTAKAFDDTELVHEIRQQILTEAVEATNVDSPNHPRRRSFVVLP